MLDYVAVFPTTLSSATRTTNEETFSFDSTFDLGTPSDYYISGSLYDFKTEISISGSPSQEQYIEIDFILISAGQIQIRLKSGISHANLVY